MRTRKTKWTMGAGVFCWLLAVSGASHASCTGDNRVGLDGTGCLTATYTNTCTFKLFGTCMEWQSNFSVWVNVGRCRFPGEKVVAKIDLAGMADKTWHFNENDTSRDGRAGGKVRGIYCCEDLGRCDQ